MPDSKPKKYNDNKMMAKISSIMAAPKVALELRKCILLYEKSIATGIETLVAANIKPIPTDSPNDQPK